jgi:4-amino-4-deoxy-L-arabinose transferase-like glycosyltransferase
MASNVDKDAIGVVTARRFITFLALVIILGGLIFIRPERFNPFNLWMLVVFAVGMVLFVLAQFIHRPIHPINALLNRFAALPQAWGWVATGLTFSALATCAMLWFEKRDYPNSPPVLILWIAGCCCCLAAFAGSIQYPANWRTWFKIHSRELLGISLVTLLAFVLRFYQLGNVPRVINGDEGWVGLTALSTINHPYANPFALWENFGALYLQAMNVLFAAFGVNPFSLRLMPAIGGVLAIPATYLLGRQIANHRVGLIAAMMLAVLHSHIHFSRTAAVLYIQCAWLIPLELYLLLSGIQKQRTWRMALAGLVLGLHFCIYLTAQLIAGMIIIYLIILLLTLKGQQKAMLKLSLVFGVALFTAILPHIVYGIGHQGEYLMRLNKDGTFNSGWLANEIGITGQNAAQILAGRVLHTFLSLFNYPAQDFYGANSPMLTIFTATLFLLGLSISLWKTRQLGHLLLNGYFWSITFAIGLLSIPPSADSYRMLAAIPAAIVMAAIGLETLLSALGLDWVEHKKGYALAVSLLLTSVMILNLWVYFFDFAGRCRYADDVAGRFASYLGNYLRSVPREQNVYLLSDDAFQFGTHPSVNFLSQDKGVTNFDNPANQLLAVPGELVVASPYRIPELMAWVRDHPGGDLHVEYDCQREILLSYKVPFANNQPRPADELQIQP